MKLSILRLSPGLSGVSWFFIELFLALCLFALPLSKSVAEISLIVALVLWALRKWPWDEPFPRAGIANAAYAAFLGAVLLSFVNVPPELFLTAARGFFKWFKYVAAFFMCAEAAGDPKRLRRLVSVFLLSMALVTANGGWQAWSGRDLVQGNSFNVPGRFARLSSSFPSPNDLAAFLLLALPLSLERVLAAARRGPKALYAALFAVLLAAFFMTLSRAAFLGLVVSSVFFLAFTPRRKWIVPALLVLAAVIFSSETLRVNFIESLDPRDITIGERLRYWQTAWRMVLEHPFIGNGVNLFYSRFPDFAPAGETVRGYAHNCYLQMWSEIGVLGLAAFLAPLAASGLAFLRELRRKAGFGPKEALFVGLTGFLLQGGADTNLYALQAAILFWVFWGLFNGVKTP